MGIPEPIDDGDAVVRQNFSCLRGCRARDQEETSSWVPLRFVDQLPSGRCIRLLLDLDSDRSALISKRKDGIDSAVLPSGLDIYSNSWDLPQDPERFCFEWSLYIHEFSLFHHRGEYSKNVKPETSVLQGFDPASVR